MQNKIIIFIFLFVISACGQDYNSNYNDHGQYSSVSIDTSTPEGARFGAAYKVLQTKCMSCHSYTHPFDESFNTSEKWIHSGYVVQGNYLASLIISTLKNYEGTMPEDPNTPLSKEELATLEAWISNL